MQAAIRAEKEKLGLTKKKVVKVDPTVASNKSSKSIESKVKDANSLYSEFESERPPEAREINKGPFNIFAIIDGHRGH